MKEYKNILDTISSTKDFDIALMTTFNFEIDFFERKILNELFANNTRKIEVFVDSKELVKALKVNRSESIFRKYIAVPVEIQSSFHPKVILMLGKEKARLIVSSANIKTFGYLQNNEIFNVFDYDKENTSNLGLIISAYRFFIELNAIATFEDKELFKETDEYIYLKREVKNNDLYFIENINESVISQVVNLIDDKVTEINIAVPYYDKELIALRNIKKQFPFSKINLYIQNKLSTFPKEINEKQQLIDKSNINIFNKLMSNTLNKFYHGKVIEFKTKSNSYILYGSSNCTQSALIKSYKDAGNIECNILEKGSIDEFNYFFDSFRIEKDVELESNEMTFDSEEKTNFSFKYGEYDNSLKLIITYSVMPKDLKIIIENNQVDYIIENNTIKINMDLEKINNIFDITLKYDNKEEKIIGWYIDYNILREYRKIKEDYKLNNIKLNYDNTNQYREAVELIQRVIPLTKEEYTEQDKINKLFRMTIKDNENDELDEDEIDDNFILSEDIPDEYIERNRNLTIALTKTKMFSNRFFGSFKIGYSKEKEFEKGKDSMKNAKDVVKHRGPTPIEKRFARFVKNNIKNILDPEYIKYIEYNHYKDVIGLMLDIINQYKYKENVDDMFDSDYVVDVTNKMILSLLSKDNLQSETDNESIIIFTLYAIIENYHLKMKSDDLYRVDSLNSELLKILNSKYNIRENFEQYLIEAVYIFNEKIYNINIHYKEIEDYINKSFGYKTKKQLTDYIKNRFGKDTKLLVMKNEIVIEFDTNKINNYWKIDKQIVDEVNRYSVQYGKEYKKLTIKIMNSAEYDEKVDYAKNVIHNIDLKTGKTNTTIMRKSGKIENFS